MASARTQVFGTYELLQLIIESLPPRKILVVQAVCKTWQKVIHENRRIQQKTFFSPVGNVVAPRQDSDIRPRHHGACYERKMTINRLGYPSAFNQPSILATRASHGYYCCRTIKERS